MIGDLLAHLSVLDAQTDGPLEHEPAIETVVEVVDRGVSEAEIDQLRDVLNDGWLER